MEKRLEKLQELVALAEPVYEWWEQNCNPYECIVINRDGAKLLQEQGGIIIKEENK